MLDPGPFLALAVAITGALAPASPGVLERVEARRVANGWGLSERAAPGVVLIAVSDCSLLGASGRMTVEDVGQFPVRVVDCQQKAHTPLAELGLAADVNRPELGHLQARIVLENVE